MNKTIITGSIFVEGINDEVYEIYQLDVVQQRYVPTDCKFSVRSNKGYDQYANGRTAFKRIERAIIEVNHRITIDRIGDIISKLPKH